MDSDKDLCRLREYFEDLYATREHGGSIDDLRAEAFNAAPELSLPVTHSKEIIPCGYRMPQALLDVSKYWNHSDERLSEEKSAIYTSYLWRQPNGGKVKVKVKLIDGTLADNSPVPPGLLSRILQVVFVYWKVSTNIMFVPWVPADGSSDIRITFEPNAFWSRHGTDARNFGNEDATMNLGLDADDVNEASGAEPPTSGGPFQSGERFVSYITHEFGHAFGAVHEHQSPNFPYEWDEKVVISYYLTTYPGIWTETMVRENILNRVASSDVSATKFDPESVMLYSFPKEFTKQGVALHENSRPSWVDQRRVSELYMQ